jgi:hypothetical protein
VKNFRVTKIFGFFGLKREEIEEAQAGDLIVVLLQFLHVLNQRNQRFLLHGSFSLYHLI